MKKLAIGLLVGALVGLWFGLNIGKGNNIFTSPFENSTLTQSQ